MITDSSSVDGAPLQRFERQLLEKYPFLVVVAIVLLTAPYADIYEGHPRNWDWLLISGMLVFLVAYPLSLRLPDQVVGALNELQSRGILQPEEAISTFQHRLNNLANRWANMGGRALAAVTCLAWLVAFAGIPQVQRYTIGSTLPGMLVEMVLAIPVGRFIGRGLCYSTLADRLRAEGITLRPNPNHWDGMAGLRPVGKIYLAHAILIIPIAFFLSTWIILLTFLDLPYSSQYSVWRLPYVGLLIFVLALEVVILPRPLYAFSRILLEWKQEMLRNAPATSARMNEHGAVTSEQYFLQKHHSRIERMPTWVLGRVACWSLAGINVALATPLLLIATGLIPLIST